MENLNAKQSVCAICLDEMRKEDGKAIFIAECSHSFHFECITKSVQYGNRICPLCRAPWKQIPSCFVPSPEEDPPLPTFSSWSPPPNTFSAWAPPPTTTTTAFLASPLPPPPRPPTTTSTAFLASPRPRRPRRPRRTTVSPWDLPRRRTILLASPPPPPPTTTTFSVSVTWDHSS